MSIFKGTIDPIIAAQLKAREKIVSQYGDSGEKDSKGNPIYKAGVDPRGDDFLRYTTGKNGWTRMTSFVDAKVGCVKEKDKKTGAYTGKEKCKYNGSDLAKKYVLEGGTLFYNKDINGFALREGVGGPNAVYASNIDDGYFRSAKTDKRPFGYRPMPGITNVSVINKGAYGSLRQATVRFYCWDKHQLDELEVLFLRVGYTVLLEWGWSQYLTHDVGVNGINSYPSNIKIDNFSTSPIDPFAPLTENDIYSQIDNGVKNNKGNYDAMLGYIQNFSWNLLPNGGFECTTILISRGEAISTIKASSSPYTLIGSATVGSATLENVVSSTGDAIEKPPLSLFEKIFLNIKAHDNQAEIYDPNGEFYVKFEDAISGSSAVRTDANNKIKDQVNQTFADIQTEVEKTTIKTVVDINGKIEKRSFKPFHTNAWLKPTDGGNDGVALEYIQLDQIIAVLTTFFLPRKKIADDDYVPTVTIIAPGKTPCLASEDSVSIDPTVCLIRNDLATFITDKPDGFNPDFWSQYANQNAVGWKQKTLIGDFNKFTYQKSNKNGTVLGQIGNIYVSISKIIDIYRSKAGSSDGVSVIDFLKDLLEQISMALGGINDFQLYTEKNTIQIIDAKYLETSDDPEGSKSSKFRFDLLGLKSICRDVRINSRVYSEQSSMIAIGAAASGDNKNLGDIYSTTQQHFNEGLKDRVVKDIQIGTDVSDLQKKDAQGNNVEKRFNYYYDLYNNIAALTGYIQRKVLGTPYTNSDGTKTGWNVVRIPASNEISNASNLLNTFILQLNGKDIDFKALIPFELEVTLDGIAGFIIGQIFTIDESILPTQYADKNVGFIITGVSHTLQNNDWVTTLKTQICLLDNDKISSTLGKTEKDKLKSVISLIRTQIKTNSYLGNAMADYLIYLTINILSNGHKFNKPFIAGTKDLPNNFKNKPGGFWDSGDSSEDPISWEDYLEDASSPTQLGDANESIKQAAEIINGDSLEFYNPNFPDIGYVYQWWKNASGFSLPNFPTKFEDLITVLLPDGVYVDLSTNLLDFQNEVLNKIGAGGSGATLGDGIAADKIFIYRYFNYTPITTLQSTQYCDTIYTPATETYQAYTHKYLNVWRLRVFYLDKIKTYISTNWGQNSQYVQVGSAGNDISLESDSSTYNKVPWWTPTPRLVTVK
jgi:hypothetical protein